MRILTRNSLSSTRWVKSNPKLKKEIGAEYFKDIFAEEQFLKIPLYENYIDLCDRKNKIASKEVKKSIIEESLEKYKFQGTYTFMGIISENKFHIYIPLDGNKNGIF